MKYEIVKKVFNLLEYPGLATFTYAFVLENRKFIELKTPFTFIAV